MRCNLTLWQDLYAIYIAGEDSYGQKVDIALENDAARRLIFELHRKIIEQEKARRTVNAAAKPKERA